MRAGREDRQGRMARKNFLQDAGRRHPDEHMVTAGEGRSLHRGQRKAPRTKVCRPCILWSEESPEIRVQGVLLDLNPYGMRIRCLQPLEAGTRLSLQMMRDDSFRDPLSPPINVEVMRTEPSRNGFVDHGVRTILKRIQPMVMSRVEPIAPSRAGNAPFHRMHTVDLTSKRLDKRRG